MKPMNFPERKRRRQEQALDRLEAEIARMASGLSCTTASNNGKPRTKRERRALRQSLAEKLFLREQEERIARMKTEESVLLNAVIAGSQRNVKTKKFRGIEPIRRFGLAS